MSKPTTEQRDAARMHATVWAGVYQKAIEHVGTHRAGDEWKTLQALGGFALLVSGQYRRIANGAEIED